MSPRLSGSKSKFHARKTEKHEYIHSDTLTIPGKNQGQEKDSNSVVIENFAE